jgi:hypothetical protein
MLMPISPPRPSPAATWAGSSASTAAATCGMPCRSAAERAVVGLDRVADQLASSVTKSSSLTLSSALTRSARRSNRLALGVVGDDHARGAAAGAPSPSPGPRAARPSSTVRRTASIAPRARDRRAPCRRSGSRAGGPESGSSPSSSASPPARLRWISSARKGVKGRAAPRSRAGSGAGSRRRPVAVPEATPREAARTSWRAPRRSRRSPAGGGAVEVVHALARPSPVGLQRRSAQRSEIAVRSSSRFDGLPRDLGRVGSRRTSSSAFA